VTDATRIAPDPRVIEGMRNVIQNLRRAVAALRPDSADLRRARRP